MNRARQPLAAERPRTSPARQSSSSADIHAAFRRAFVPVAAFDERLVCRAVNSAFASMVGVSQQHCLDKTMPEILKSAAPRFEAAIQKAWRSGEFLRNLRITVRPAGRRSERRWAADFFPLPDDPHLGKLVGVAFSEITTRCKIESRIHRLARSRALNSPNAFSPNTWVCAPLPRGYLELMQRTLGLLTSSAQLRRLLSEARVAASLRTGALRKPAGQPAGTFAALPDARVAQDATSDSPAATGAPVTLHGFNRPSSRELQVLRFLAEGRCNKEIASALRLSIRTVETYRARLMSKLRVHSAAEAVCYAIRNHLLQP